MSGPRTLQCTSISSNPRQHSLSANTSTSMADSVLMKFLTWTWLRWAASASTLTASFARFEKRQSQSPQKPQNVIKIKCLLAKIKCRSTTKVWALDNCSNRQALTAWTLAKPRGKGWTLTQTLCRRSQTGE